MELGRIVLLKIIKDLLEAFSKRTEISNKNIKGFVIFLSVTYLRGKHVVAPHFNVH